MTAERRSGIQFQRLFDLNNCIVISTCVIQEVRQSRLKERIQRIEFDRFLVFRDRLVYRHTPPRNHAYIRYAQAKVGFSSMARSKSMSTVSPAKAPPLAQARDRCASVRPGTR